MTVLGAVFVAAYVVSIFRGRRGVLMVLACAIPFNDSAALIVGEATVSPFYLGLLIYVAMSLLAPSLRRPDAPPAPRGVLLALLIFGAISAVIAPMLFEGIGVVAPGIGLDEQVGALTPLQFSLSSVAQVAYLMLNLGLIFFNERDRLLAQRHLAVGLGVGVLIGLWAYAGWRLGAPFPQEFFDNNPRGQYIPNPGRLRAQFSEASHLGGFSVAAVAFFSARIFQSTNATRVIGNSAFTASSALLLVSTVSGTATLGAIVALAVLVLIAVIAVVRRGVRGVRIPPAAFLAALALLVVIAFAIGPVTEAVVGIVEGKQGGTSIETRGYVDGRALALASESWGFGVGLGNNRSSSMVLMLLSTIGIVGTLLFAIIVIRAVRNGLPDPSRRASVIALVAFVSAAAVSLADFVSPIMWVAIALCFPPSAGDGGELSPTARPAEPIEAPEPRTGAETRE